MWWETVGWLSPTGSVMSQTHAPLSDGGGDHREQLDPSRIAERLEHPGERLGGLVADDPRGHRRAARRQRGRARARGAVVGMEAF